MTGFAIDDGVNPAVTFTFDLNGDGGVAGQSVRYYTGDPGDLLVDRIVEAVQIQMDAGNLSGLSLVNEGGGAVRVDGASSVVLTGAGLTLAKRLPLDITVLAHVIASDDGKTFTVSDGTDAVTFEFYNLSAAPHDLSDSSHYGILYTPPATPATIAGLIAAAINDAVSQRRLTNLTATGLATGSVHVEYANAVLAVRDDEDGIVFLDEFNKGTTVTRIQVTASGPGFLDAWVDFNRNGVFDTLPNEHIFQSVAVVAGTQILTTSTPSWASTDPAKPQPYARFRISPTGNLAPYGLAIGGEVEDYRVEILAGTPPVPNDDQYTLEEDPNDPDALVHFTTSVLANDTDAEDTPLTSKGGRAFLVTPPQHARPDGFKLYPDGTFDYFPVKDYNNGGLIVDTFTYRAMDPRLMSNGVATVTITVNPRTTCRRCLVSAI